MTAIEAAALALARTGSLFWDIRDPRDHRGVDHLRQLDSSERLALTDCMAVSYYLHTHLRYSTGYIEALQDLLKDDTLNETTRTAFRHALDDAMACMGG